MKIDWDDLEEFSDEVKNKLKDLVNEVEEIRTFWKRSRHYLPLLCTFIGVVLLTFFNLPHLMGIAGFTLSAGGMFMLIDRVKDLKKVRQAGAILHEVLFAAYGTHVSKFANDLWKALDLKPKGLPDIRNGRT